MRLDEMRERIGVLNHPRLGRTTAFVACTYWGLWPTQVSTGNGMHTRMFAIGVLAIRSTNTMRLSILAVRSTNTMCPSTLWERQTYSSHSLCVVASDASYQKVRSFCQKRFGIQGVKELFKIRYDLCHITSELIDHFCLV